MVILSVLLALALVGAIIYIVYVMRRAADARRADMESIVALRESSSALNERVLSLEGRLQQADKALSDANAENVSLHDSLRESAATAGRLQERLSFLDSERSRLDKEAEQRFRLLAQEILEANSGKFGEQSRQGLMELLSPLKVDIDRFKQQVESAYSSEARERFALSERIKELVELNMSIGREAKDLARALRGDSKVQGDWGEMVLETMLEKSGLVKGVHFEVQVTTDDCGDTLRDAKGRHIRPDAIVNYPDGRCVVIDSKVSVTRYIDMVNAEAASAEYASALADHVRSVRSHIVELAAKNYQDFIGAKRADFVIMFIPNEGAYIAAMQADNRLWQEAYDKRVLIVSPTHLISVLKLIEQMWRQEDMKKNVSDIADESGRMYDKFVGFVDDMLRIEKALTQATSAYDDAIGKLSTGRGNLIRKAENLRSMGAKVSKRINASLADKAIADE